MIPSSINNLQSLIKSLALPTAWIVAQMVASFQQARPTRTKRTSCPFQTPFYGRWRKKRKMPAGPSHICSVMTHQHHLIGITCLMNMVKYTLSLSLSQAFHSSTDWLCKHGCFGYNSQKKKHAIAAPRLWGHKHSKLPCQLHLEVVLPDLLERPPGKAVVETG